MNIIIYSHYFFPSVGGLEVNTEVMARALIESGHKVTVITATPLGNNTELNNGYKIIRSRALPTLIKAIIKADLVIVNGNVSVPVGIASFLTLKPEIIIYQMAGDIVPPARSFFHKLSNYLRIPLVNYAKLNVGVSKACVISKNFKDNIKTEVLYNPIHPDLITFKNELEKEHSPLAKKYDLLFAGRVIKGKGVFVLAEALKLLDNDSIRLRVCISGNGSDLDALKEELKNLKNIEVNFQGFVKGKELAKTFFLSKFLVLPSTTHQEGSPLSIAEAFAFGLPVISSDQPVMKELIKDAGYTFKSGNAIELKEKILLLIKGAEHYRLVSERAYKNSHTFLYPHYKEELIKIIKEVN